jgi:membrane dipeptidase
MRILLLLSSLCCGVIFGQSIGIDSHIDTMQRVLIEKVDLGQRLADGHVDISRLRQGGVNVPFFALWVPIYYKGAEAVRRTLDLRDAAQQVFDQHPTEIELARTVADIQRITAAKKIAVILTIEGGHQIDDDLAVLRVYHSLGIRSMTLTHFRNTGWADASTDKPRNNGLTDFGKEVVREMNRLGMIVDLSHVSDKTFNDALAVTTKPVIVSHSSCRAISPIPRNVTDEMLHALARNGGVIGINLDSGFLNAKEGEAIMRLINKSAAKVTPDLTGRALDVFAAEDHKEFQKSRKTTATVDDAVNNIDHAVKIAGIDHVGIGSDYDGGITPPLGLEDISTRPALVGALKKRGYSQADIDKIMGGNFLRVMRAVFGK